MWSPSFPFALFRLAYVWAGACTALHGCLHAALKPQRLPRLSALSRKELGVLVNTLVAGCHAGVMFWGTARYMLSRFEPTWRVFTITQVSPNSPTENRYCDLMLGYLLYDCAVGVLAGGNGADILAHHLAGLASWACLRLYDTGGIYMMWVHLAEGSTPFLHATTVLFKLGWGNTVAYRVCGLSTLLSFTLVRVLSQPLCQLSMWRTRALWGEHRYLFVTMMGISNAFIALNTLWWTKLLKRALGRKGALKRSRGHAPEAAARAKDA